MRNAVFTVLVRLDLCTCYFFLIKQRAERVQEHTQVVTDWNTSTE